MEVSVQFFQSIIAVELAITGALLCQVRYFERPGPDLDRDQGPDARLRILVAVVLGATIFGSLDGIVHHGGRDAAIFVTLGVALSAIPTLTRVLPPLIGEAGGHRTYSTITILALGLYAAAVLALILLLGR